jgi:Zn-dependent protease/CBS domain-containing protein
VSRSERTAAAEIPSTRLFRAEGHDLFHAVGARLIRINAAVRGRVNHGSLRHAHRGAEQMDRKGVMLTKRFELFSILGFRVSLDLSWIILALLITWSLATGYFPQAVEGLSPTAAWWLGGAGALGLFVSIILHEFAHAFVARQFNIPIRGITLFIFGGVAEMEEEPPSARSEFYMAIAGPAMSYVLAALFYVLAGFAPGHMGTALFGYLAFINTVLATFNLIPAFPLDGGRVFRSLFWGWTNDYARATRVSATLGRAFGITLILLGLLNLTMGHSISGIWQALIGFFIINAAAASEMQMTLQIGLEDKTVAQIMTRNPVWIPAHMPLNDAIERIFYRHPHRLFPVLDDGRLLGGLRIEDVGRIAQEERSHVTTGDLVQATNRTVMVAPDMPVLKALRLMQQRKTSRLIVADGHLLKGMLTMRDIIGYLEVRQELGQEGKGANPFSGTRA